MKYRCNIDDSLDVLAVHGVGGATGTLLVAFLATSSFGGSGLPEGATAVSQFGVQLTGVIVTAVWSAIATAAIVMVVRSVCGLRVSDDDETEGLDYVQHGEVGYRNKRDFNNSTKHKKPGT